MSNTIAEFTRAMTAHYEDLGYFVENHHDHTLLIFAKRPPLTVFRPSLHPKFTKFCRLSMARCDTVAVEVCQYTGPTGVKSHTGINSLTGVKNYDLGDPDFFDLVTGLLTEYLPPPVGNNPG